MKYLFVSYHSHFPSYEISCSSLKATVNYTFQNNPLQNPTLIKLNWVQIFIMILNLF